MELGVHGLNMNAAVDPHDTARLARRVEELGYGSWWAADHVVLPTGPDSPRDPTGALIEPLVHLSYVASVTTRLELGTGVVILPQRNPLVLAKQAASLDVLSGGRLLLGLGSGWLAEEMRAVGVSPINRGARTNEYIDSMRSLWTDKAPSYRGEYVSFDAVDAHPRPVRSHGPHVVIGGTSDLAFRRAVTRGHGWYGIGNSPTDLTKHLDGLRRVAEEVDRPAHLGRLEISFLHLNPDTVDDDTAREYADLGADRLVLYPGPISSAGQTVSFLDRHADLASRVL
ncbi:TIGR03619 family F420-dependent LLM class oxidoreductase [Phytoactinopolyspora endophytica]|uniref:TIGR03619 family F420-dependent LLM class oxidoreductase n=1 Tax=Phytoactinopolyspora endophytica TaxID=1642495 RepID=UPI00101B8F8D|nr:TIGR03619 family F420-dependent LLM class oxidoreductase [Phytoactinopolyspora endophytica]